MRPLALACALTLVTPALAQTAAPLEEAAGAQVRDRAPLKERLWSLARRATKPVPHLRGLVPKTRGDLELGVVLVEFEDVARPDWGPKQFDDALFSRGTYTRTATGQVAHGSMRDYYLENSSGALDITGDVHAWVKVAAKRAEVEPKLLADAASRRAVFNGAIDQVLERDGHRAFFGKDALVFVVAGDQAKKRGSILWPHSGVLFHKGRAWRYYLMHAGSKRFEPIGIHCHEMGHVLGILDKYGTGRHTGLGQWCLMAQGGSGGRTRGVPLDAPRTKTEDKLREVVNQQLEQLRDVLGGGRRAPSCSAPARSAGKSRPLHLCGVCKHRLGWTKAKALDPSRAQRIYLTPVEDDASQVARIPLDRRGREAVYLEYRARRGFDADLPDSGLFVWRAGSPTAMLRTFVPFERTELVPAHGVEGIDAPHRAPTQVAFPNGERTSVTVRGTLPGSWAVTLSDIREADGRLFVEVGPAR